MTFKIIISLLFVISSSYTSNVEIIISRGGVKKVNHCNTGIMNSFMPEVIERSKRVAWKAEENVKEVCPNNQFTCCTREEMEPMLEQFKETREMLIFKNKMLEKLLMYFNTVAIESFNNFTSSFSENEIKCTGQKDYQKMETYYKFIQDNSHEVLTTVKKTTLQVLNLYSSFVCSACSPINEKVYTMAEETERSVLFVDKGTCQNIVQLGLDRKNLIIVWNQINKIIHAIMCKERNQKKMHFDTRAALDLKFYFYESCLEDDQAFTTNTDCADLCRDLLGSYSFSDLGLFRINMAIEELQKTFELRLGEDEKTISETLMFQEETRHRNLDFLYILFNIIKI